MTKQFTYDALRDMVNGIWLADGSHNRHDDIAKDPDYTFRDFLRGYSFKMPKLENVKFIQREGGGAGGAQDCESVILVNDVYYKVFYTYRSYEGFEWCDAEVVIVEPVERLVMFYE